MDKLLKQDDIIEITVIDNGMEGEGIAKYGEYTVFIPFCLKGETVKAKIRHVKKNTAFAELINVVTPSSERINPPCNRFGKCGGCDLMHVSYPTQLEIKRENVIRLLKKNAGIDFPVEETEPCSTPFAYRNKIQLPFGFVKAENRVTLGFYRENSHKVVAITKCFLHGEWAEILIKIFLEYANKFNLSVYDEVTKKGHLKHLVARYVDGNISIVLVTDGNNIKHADFLIKKLSENFPSFSLYQSKKPENTNVIMGKTLIPIVEKPFIIDVLGIKLKLNPYSFLQLNDEIRDKIYRKVIDGIEENSVVIDAYAGVGILGAVLAKKGCKVYNIEIVKEATADGNRLAEMNGISKFITNINGDVAEILPRLAETLEKEKSLTVLLDPPRKGCEKSVLDAIIGLNKPVTLYYISCNPATLTRDLKILSDGGFTPAFIKPYDMFPNTRHVETLAVLHNNGYNI